MKVWIDDSCTACGLCEDMCPEVFQVDETAWVIEANIEGNEDLIMEASEECPAEAIVIEDDDDDDIDKEEEELLDEEDALY